MATKNIVPRADKEGQIGTNSKRWNLGLFYTLLSNLKYVEIKTDNYSVQTTDFGKTFVMNAADKTFSLPSVSASDIGATLTFIHVGTKNLTIDAADADTISDSGAGDGIYCEQAGEIYASVTIMLATETAWIIKDAKGTWISYD